jgi:hypothetical protein
VGAFFVVDLAGDRSGAMREEEMVVAIVAIVTTIGLPFLGLMFWLVLHYSASAWKSFNENRLKREMVARGYTAQEIVQVVGAKKGSKFTNTTDVPPAKPVKQPAYGY